MISFLREVFDDRRIAMSQGVSLQAAELFRATFHDFAKRSRVSVAQASTLTSYFPMLEDRLTKRLKVVPEDMVFFTSGSPISTLLGAPQNPKFDLVRGGLVLISANAILRVTAGIMSVSLGANDLKDIQNLYGAFASILSLYTEFFPDVLQPVVETLAALYKQINKPELLTNLQRLAPAVIGGVVSLWTFKVNLDDHSKDRAVVDTNSYTFSESMFLRTLRCRSEKAPSMLSQDFFSSFGGNRRQSHQTNER
jgi:hypothetical protein